MVLSAKHKGRSPSLKAAYERAKGIYLGWVDSDDLLASTALAKTASILDNKPEVFHLNESLYYYRNHRENISTEERLEQISWSREAVNRALKRRGLDTHFELDVQIISRFSLRRKKVK